MHVPQDVRQTTYIQQTPIMESEPASELPFRPRLAFATAWLAMMKLVSARRVARNFDWGTNKPGL